MNASDLVYTWRHPQTGVVFPPLLVMLQQAVATGTEHSRAGGTDPSTRSVVATDALDLLGNISGNISEVMNSKMPLLWEVRAVYEWARAEDVDYWLSRLSRWADDIWAIFEPPKLIALRDLECPNCGMTRYVTADGVSGVAMTVHVNGNLSAATCHNCRKVWEGWAALALLGILAGTKPDMDAVSEEIKRQNAS